MKYHEIKPSSSDFIGTTEADELVVACDRGRDFKIGEIVILRCGYVFSDVAYDPKLGEHTEYSTKIYRPQDEIATQIVEIDRMHSPVKVALLLRRMSKDEYRSWEDDYRAYVRREIDKKQNKINEPYHSNFSYSDELQKRLKDMRKRWPPPK